MYILLYIAIGVLSASAAIRFLFLRSKRRYIEETRFQKWKEELTKIEIQNIPIDLEQEQNMPDRLLVSGYLKYYVMYWSQKDWLEQQKQDLFTKN